MLEAAQSTIQIQDDQARNKQYPGKGELTNRFPCTSHSWSKISCVWQLKSAKDEEWSGRLV